jgi:hypothetical protein
MQAALKVSEPSSKQTIHNEHNGRCHNQDDNGLDYGSDTDVVLIEPLNDLGHAAF